MSTEIQLPVAAEGEEAMLESMIADAQARVFALRKQKEAHAAVAQRAERLANLKQKDEVDAAGLLELEETQIPAEFAALKQIVQERYERTHGRSNMLELNTKVKSTTERLVRLLEDVHRRKANREKVRKEVDELQQQVDADAQSAKNAEAQP